MLIKSTRRVDLESIKEINPGEYPLEITFEVLKKLDDKEDGLLCRICDDTGASDAIFQSPIKKYIEEGQVYTARHAIAEVVNAHIRIELFK